MINAALSDGDLKFAVVREDPGLEAALVRRLGARAALVVASGGCTALSLVRLFPGLSVTAFDRQPAQLAHLQAKRAAVAASDVTSLNVADDCRDGLNQRGAFEGLFRLLRAFVEEYVASPAEIGAVFDPEVPEETRCTAVARWTSSRYWPAAFATVFNDPLLVAMFGPAALQHAVAGSYPGYFQAAFARGLADPGAARNPFLQHVFLGRYRAADAPAYVRGGRLPPVELVAGSLLEVPDLERFDLFSLSNVFDWSDDALVGRWAQVLAREARPGSAVLLRQLNNQRDLRRFFRPAFRFDDDLGRTLLAADRSLFYNAVSVGFRA